jgi:anti-anti-sigma regulatory factor
MNPNPSSIGPEKSSATPGDPVRPAAQPTTLGPSLTLYTAEEVRVRLMDLLQLPGDLVLDLSQVEKCDCAGLQLLCSAQKSAVMSGRHIRIIYCSQAILAAAEAIGLQRDAFMSATPNQP